MNGNDITTQDLDQTVQATLTDWRISPHKRAKIALEVIEMFARAEAGLDALTTLPVPLEWEHRVAGIAQDDNLPIIEGEIISDSAEDAEEQEKFNKFWKWGR